MPAAEETFDLPDALPFLALAAAMKEMGIATALGLVGAAAWASVAGANHREWARVNKVRRSGLLSPASERTLPPNRVLHSFSCVSSAGVPGHQGAEEEGLRGLAGQAAFR